MVNESTFARQSLREYYLCMTLADHEKNDAFRKNLEELARTAREEFDFWARKSGVRGDEVQISRIETWFFLRMRALLGLSFTAKYIVKRKKESVAAYMQYCSACNVDADGRAVTTFIERLQSISERLEKECL